MSHKAFRENARLKEALQAVPPDNDSDVGARLSRPQPPTGGRVLVRIVAWLVAVARIAFNLRFGLRKGKRRAVYVRRVVESLGGSATILVRQLAMRLELFPLDIATELSRLNDSAPPMPLDTALTEFKRYLHKDVTEVFEAFDPEPILATHMDCVYQAVLRSGEKVAVRIMRPEAELNLRTERFAAAWVVKLLASLMPSYKERFVALRDELPFIEREVIDFANLARLHRVLEKELKRWKVKKKFHVAKIYFKVSSRNVIVSEFIEGFWLHDVLGAYETGDEEALARLAERNIDPAKCGWRAFEFCLWSTLENTFSLAAPRASQFGVMPGNKLILVQVGTVGTLGRYQRRVYTTIFQKLLERDFEGIAELLIQSLFPLPPIDVYQFTKAIERRLVAQMLAIENKDAPQWIRSGTGLWVGFLEEVQSFGVFVPGELSRVIQSLCVFSEIAFRLDPKTSLRKRIRRYLNNSYRRGARDVVRNFRNPDKRGGRRITNRPRDITDTIAQARMSLESVVEKVPVALLASTRKSGHALAQVVDMVFTIGKIAGVWLAIKIGLQWRAGEEVNVLSESWSVVTHPAFLLIVAFFFAIMARRIQFRLDDLDPDDN